MDHGTDDEGGLEIGNGNGDRNGMDGILEVVLA
jgi:hypothetical protein